MQTIRIIYFNNDGEKVDQTFDVDELCADLWGDRERVPSNYAPIFSVERDGVNITNIIPKAGRTRVFEDVVNAMGWKNPCVSDRIILIRALMAAKLAFQAELARRGYCVSYGLDDTRVGSIREMNKPQHERQHLGDLTIKWNLKKDFS